MQKLDSNWVQNKYKTIVFPKISDCADEWYPRQLLDPQTWKIGPWRVSEAIFRSMFPKKIGRLFKSLYFESIRKSLFVVKIKIAHIGPIAKVWGRSSCLGYHSSAQSEIFGKSIFLYYILRLFFKETNRKFHTPKFVLKTIAQAQNTSRKWILTIYGLGRAQLFGNFDSARFFPGRIPKFLQWCGAFCKKIQCNVG